MEGEAIANFTFADGRKVNGKLIAASLSTRLDEENVSTLSKQPS